MAAAAAHGALLLPLLLLQLQLPRTSGQCAGTTYGFDALATASQCSPCAASATFVSSSQSCRPLAALGPSDTAFYLSGSQAEGVAAFDASTGAPAYVADRQGNANAALALSGSAYLATPSFAASPAFLPSAAGVSASVAAFVKCPSSIATQASVLEWGAAAAGTSAAKLSLYVTAPNSTTAGQALYTANGGVSLSVAGAGNSTNGYADGVGSNAIFSAPLYVALDNAYPPNAFVADFAASRLRRVTPLGVVTTIGGSGSAGFKDGIGTSALLNQPIGVAFDALTTNLYVADFTSDMIRRAVFNATTGLYNITTIAGGGAAGTGAGYVDGTGTAALLSGIHSIAADSLGNLWVCDTNNNRIRKVTAPASAPTTSSVAGGGSATGVVAGYADGVGSGATFSNPQGLAVDSAIATVYVTDSLNYKIRRIVIASLTVTTLAGGGAAAPVAGTTDGVGSSALFTQPTGIAIDPSNTVLYVCDGTGNAKVRRLVIATSTVTTLTATFGSQPEGIAVDTLGNLLVADRLLNRLVKVQQTLKPEPIALPVCDGTWHHVALSYGSGVVTAFVDGVQLGTSANQTLAIAAGGGNALRVGWNGLLSSNGGDVFTGAVADMRIYSRTLAAADAVALTLPLLPAGPFANTIAPNVSQGVTAYTWPCVANFYGPPATYQQSVVDNSWAWVSGITPTCAPCPASSSSAPGATTCTCSAGFTASGLGASLSCSCFAGSVLAGSGSGATCTACSAGTYSSSLNSATCATCASVNANCNSNAGAVTCTCSANYFASGSGATLACSPCPSGSTSANGPASCTCNAGFIATGSGSTLACTCPAGFVLAGTGTSATCLPCPPGQFSSSANSASCSQCAANSYSYLGGAASCATCPAGSAANSGTGSTGCTCGPNMSTSGSNATLTCTACALGAFAAAGSATCTCGPVWVSNALTGSSLKCTCPAGYTASGAGATAVCVPPAGLPFTMGNLVLLRVGDGSHALTTLAPAFFDEYTPTGSLVQSVATTLGVAGTDTTVASLARSATGQFLAFAGVGGVGPGIAAGSAPFFGPYSTRAVARVDASAVVDATTSISVAAYNGIIRGACTVDGTGYYLTGNSSIASSLGIAYVAHGGAAPPVALYSATSDFSGCGAFPSASGPILIFLRGTAAGAFAARAAVSPPPTSGTIALMSLNGGFVLSGGGDVSYWPTQVAVNAAGTSIYISDLQSLPTAPNPGIWLSQNNGGAAFSVFVAGYTATGLALSPNEATLFFVTPLGLYSVFTSCAAPCASVYPKTAFAAGTSMEWRGLALTPCGAGTSGFYCVPCAIGAYTTSGGQASCAACPAGATTAAVGGTSCVCAANFYQTPTGTCAACPSGSTASMNSAACTCSNAWAVWNSSAANCFASATPTATATGSATATSSSTSSATASGTASATMTSTSSSSATATTSATSSQSPSPTPSPDVLLLFSFSLAPAVANVQLSIASVSSHSQISTSIKASFSSLLGAPSASFVIVNISDVATGATTTTVAQRRLGAVAGSLGVAIWVELDLGKSPSLSATSDMVSALASLTPGAAITSTVFGPIILATASWNGQVATAYAAAFNVASISVVNSAFGSLVYAALAPTAAASSASSNTGGIIGGVIAGAVTVLFCGIWSWRSWQKHGVLPCLRDRAEERREALAQQFDRNKLGGGGGDLDVSRSNPVGGGGDALVVRALAKQVAEQQAEVSRLNAQVAAEKAVSNALKERGKSSATLAGPKAQLRAEEAAKQAITAARASFTPTSR